MLALKYIFPCATPADEANKVADYFASVKSGEAMPALCVADPTMFTEIVSAFAARGIKLHNPARTPLTASTLGHLVFSLVSLKTLRSFAVFSSLIRSGDIRRWMSNELKLTESDVTELLKDLDLRQAEYLPETIDDIAPKTQGKLRLAFDFLEAKLRKYNLRDLLAVIFAGYHLAESDPHAREFAAAAKAINTLIDECGDDYSLLAFRLAEETFSLEIDEGDAVITDGWMELPYLDADELVIVGFQEGCVPESIVGHPFLPDSLRTRLGLTDNAAKEARDREIFKEAIESRTEGAVRVYFHAVDAKGDATRPSRLLFETPNDEDFLARVNSLYGYKAGTSSMEAFSLPETWKLNLPIPPAYEKLTCISPTRVDAYLRCPFTYYLQNKNILGDKRLKNHVEELESWEYGNLAHTALERFGSSAIKDSTDYKEIAEFLSMQVDAQLVERFGSNIPAIVAMQGESVKRRLSDFAKVEAEHTKEGWRIVAVERRMQLNYGETRLHGKCDRIDFNDRLGKWCIIDYKTWDKLIAREGVQLALYCAMLDADKDFPEAKRDNILSAYCILGKTRQETGFSEMISGEVVVEAERQLREAISKIEKGIFWPPAPTQEWRYDFKDWLIPSPEESVSEKWIKDQLARQSVN